MKNNLLYLLPVASAALVTVSFAPYDLGFAAWFGLAPLLYALRRCSGPRAVLCASLFGILLGAGTYHWATSLVSVTNVVIMVVLHGLFYLFFGLLYSQVWKRIGPWMILGAPALWVTTEYARSNLFFLSWPWNLLGHSQYLYLPVIQIGECTGVYGISFLLVMVNQVVSELPDALIPRGKAEGLDTGRFGPSRGWSLRVAAVTFLVAAVLGYGLHRRSATEGNQTIRVALVQPNVLVRANMPSADQQQHMLAYELLTKEAASGRPDLILWPSSSLPAPMSTNKYVQRTVRRLARETGAYLLVGGTGHEKMKPTEERQVPFSNSEFLVSPSGGIVGQYDKVRLLPFNEVVPLSGIISWPEWMTTLKSSFLHGEKYTLFRVAGAKFGTPICWENLFADSFRRFVREGANFMVSVTSDGFFGRNEAPYQTLAMNAFRAVENRVAVVRVSTTGISAFINPNGEIVERVRDGSGQDLFVSGFLVRDVPLRDRKTFYTLYGDVFAMIAMGLAALVVAASLYRGSAVRLMKVPR